MNGDSIPQWLQCCNNTPRSFVLPISPDGWLYPDFISAENTPMLVHFVSCIPILFPNSCNDLYSSHYYIHTHIVIIYIYYLYISYTLYRSIMFHLPFLMKPRYRPGPTPPGDKGYLLTESFKCRSFRCDAKTAGCTSCRPQKELTKVPWQDGDVDIQWHPWQLDHVAQASCCLG